MTDIEGAIDFLEKNLGPVFTVTEWAEEVGYSRMEFHRRIKITFGKTPIKILNDVKLKAIKKRFKKHPKETLLESAIAIGFSDDIALGHFIKRKLQITPTELKKEINSDI